MSDEVLIDGVAAVNTSEIEPSMKRFRRSTDCGEDAELQSLADSSCNYERGQVRTGGIVKIYTVHTEPNYALPWTTKHQFSSTATGFAFEAPSTAGGALEGSKYLLTNAHAVVHAAVVQVRTLGSPEKFTARLLCVGEECDLALLTVDDERFWEFLGSDLITINPVLPNLNEAVTVIGYPVGGDNISVTQGIISRIDLQEYAHGSVNLLAIQIDAAINPGNSGGPALNAQGALVGVAFQALRDGESENIGYIIPSEIVLHFLEDFARNKVYTGFGDCGFGYQRLENSHMRQALGMSQAQSGVLIRRVPGASPVKGVLEVGDVVLEVDGCRVANDGTVVLRVGERVPFNYRFNRRFTGELVKMRILRPASVSDEDHHNVITVSEHVVDVSVGRLEPLVPCKEEIHPKYITFGGLVFTPLTESYLKAEFGDHFQQDAPVRLLSLWQHGFAERPGHEVLLLTQVLASELTVGFVDMRNLTLDKINGKKVWNIKELDNELEASRKIEKWTTFQFSNGEKIIVSNEQVHLFEDAILRRNLIPLSKRL